MKKSVIGAAGLGLFVVGTFLVPDPEVPPPEPSWMKYRTVGRQPVVGLGDPERLREQYDVWKEITEEPYVVELFPSDQLADPGAAGGWMRLDLEGRRVTAALQGVGDDAVDLWLIDNADWPDNPAVPDAEDRMVRVGRLTPAAGDYEVALDVPIEDIVDSRMSIDVVVATPSGTDPLDGQLLFYGAPTLFQRLYALEQRLAEEERPVRGGGLLAFAVAAPQSPKVPIGFPDVFSDLVTEGENLFFNETFKGNGRSCGTCHFAVNNFTIDVDLIASLPPTDPLFVAETQPPLIFGHLQNLDPVTYQPRRFENPALMRAFGLIVENLDGFGDLKNRFTMRSVPHNIGMRVSVNRGGGIGFPDGPDERTGWSGDGSPFGLFTCLGATDPASPGILVRGTTRSFALGAVIQHFPRTLARSFCGPNADFRLPTDDELDAFEAFFFALGRQQELNIQSGATNELILASDVAEKGKILFRDPGVGEFPNQRTCNACHTNMGANPGGVVNANIDTNVEEFLRNRLNDPDFTVVGEPRPIDGGFGLNPGGTFDVLTPGPGNGNENFGNGQFNTVSLVEAADSAPFFHANVAFTVEESIEFYASPEFSPNPAGRILFTTEERDQVSAFMRAVNALDNIESLAAPRAKKAAEAITVSAPNADAVIDFLLEVAIAEVNDAIEVLEASDLHDSGPPSGNAVHQLGRAKIRFAQAQNASAPDSVRLTKIEQGVAFLKEAVAIIRVNP
jgi:cytochrome c peroxidase